MWLERQTQIAGGLPLVYDPGWSFRLMTVLTLTTGTMIVVIAPDGRVRAANDTLCAALGRDESELLGADWFDAAVPVNVQAPWRRRVADGRTPALRLRAVILALPIVPIRS